MKITGIIAEYNIFHNGHKYQIDEVKKRSDAVIAVMSGGFVQRGSVAAADKWTRARAALAGGVDLVIELPVIYALNTAQKFAYGAVSVLNLLGAVSELCFGSECGDISVLSEAARILDNETREASEKIKSLVSSGMSYPAAREAAFEGAVPRGILSEPNNILAVEYIRALNGTGSKIVPVTIKRKGAEHNSDKASDGFASASAIREMMRNGDDIKEYVPPAVYDIIKKADAPYSLSNLDSAVISLIRLSDERYLESINDVSEGLHNRIKSAAMECSSIDELAERVKTKRYTRTRINRVLLSSLLGLTKDLCSLPPSYIRVLGMNDTGREIIREIKTRSSLPVIVKTADYGRNDPIFDAEIRATDIASLCSPNKSKRIGGRDYLTAPVVWTDS